MTTNANLTSSPPHNFTTSSIIVISNHIMNLSVGLSLNVYVLFLLFTRCAGLDMDVTFTASQSASELLLSFTSPLSILCHVDPRLCFSKAVGFLWGISMSSRHSFQCCVCLERYLAVVHPITFLKYNHTKYRLACAVLIWIFSLSMSVWCMGIFPFLPFTDLAVLYGTVLTVNLFCCLSILKVLRRPRPGRTEKRKERDQADVNGVKKKAFKIVCMNIMTCLLQAVPLSFVFSSRQHFTSLEAFNLAVGVCMMVNFLAGFVQPLVFLHKADANLTSSTLYETPPDNFTTSSILFIFNHILNLSVGLSLNVYVLFLLFTRGAGFDMNVTFTASQSASELLLSFTSLLSILCHVDPRLCCSKAVGFLWGISMSSRHSFQCCVCLERYLAVVHPITFLKYNHTKWRLACAVLIWISSLAISVWCMGTFPFLPFTVLAVIYGTVLTVDLFCCLSILKVLRRPRPGRTEKRKERDQADVNGVKKKAFKIVCMNIMTCLLQAVPLSFVFSSRQHFTSLEAFNLAVGVCMIVNFLAGFVQSLVFLHKVGKLALIRCFN